MRKANEESMRAPCARSMPAPSCSAVCTGLSTGNPSPCSTLPPYGLQGTETTSGGTETTSGGPDTPRWYGEDLAYIHDIGHAEFALGAAPGIMEILDRNVIHHGLVVDLGCGSGLWARKLVDAGYRVLGIDISEAMIELSRNRVPEAEFRVVSLFEAEIPRCQAVTAVSEVLNYLFDAENEERGLGRLFRRVYDALVPGGVFVFDVLGPGQVPPGTRARGFRMGEDWAVLFEREEDVERETMERRIVSFRKAGVCYRRGEEGIPGGSYNQPSLSPKTEGAGFRVQ